MGRATEGFHFINLDSLDLYDDSMYTSLFIDDEMKKLRKERIAAKKAAKKGLKAKADGTFILF
jgi:hypothetical protein